MRYYFNLDQRVMQCFDITFDEAAIVHYVRGLENSDSEEVKAQKVTIQEEDDKHREYVWVSQKNLLKEISQLKIKTTQGLRLEQNRLIKEGVLLGFSLRGKKKNYWVASYFRTSDCYQEIEKYFRDHKNSELLYEEID